MYEFLTPDWKNMLQVLITVPFLYAVVVFSVRVTGNRSTSAMNNFDWIVTVAIGSIFASCVILKETNLIEGAFGITILLVLQFCLTWAVERYGIARKIMKATPQLLVFEGHFLDDNMQRERIIEGEVYAAIRNKGYKSVRQIYAVVLETNGTLSVIPSSDNEGYDGFSLSNVDGLPEGLREDLEAFGEEDDTEEGPD